ncbi:MAG TPA: DUF6644 family protein [Bryobacteraceae bacterium]|nr:DUF6644 family protein [Bryobacteraceae bacterium]
MLGESFRPYFEWAGNTWLGTSVRDTEWAFPLIETFHLLALAILLGSVLLISLRVFGVGKRYLPAAQLARQFEPWMLVSICVLIATGIPMAFSEPMKCFESYSFPVKMGLMLLGIAAQLTIHRRWIVRGDASPAKTRIAALASILIWTAVGAAGKAIPYI